jgi:hypothetical protein
MEELQLEHSSGQLRYYVDTSKVSLRAVLLHTENTLPATSLAGRVYKNVRERSGFAAK